MRICYCEDETAQAQLLKAQIGKWADKHNTACRIDLYQSAEEFLFKTKAYTYDLLFLDIAMSKMNGMELAGKIREKDPDVEIVFVTSDKSYVFDGYEVNALRYLVKPIEVKKLYEVLDLVSDHMKSEKKDYVVFKVENETVRIPTDDIAYVEACGHFVEIYRISGGNVPLKDSFAHVLEVLNAAGKVRNAGGRGNLITGMELFVLAHRSYAVNLKMVDQIGRTECILSDGSRVPVSRNAYKRLNEAFIRFNMEY